MKFLKVSTESQHQDIVRIKTLELLAEEIKNNDVKGSCAELGVYQGEFARQINKNFPNKKLYLFDTFQGFDKRDIKNDMEKNFSKGDQNFSNTSISIVMAGMSHRKNVRIKKGWFPESTKGIEDTFAFVSVDADLYGPIYSGLEYFYPRLEKGGYIMIHDYNNPAYKGAKEAVNKFCEKYYINRIPVCDHSGSVIISK